MSSTKGRRNHQRAPGQACVERVDVAESADDGSRKGRGQRNYGMWCRDGRKGVENDREAKALEWGPVLCERAISIAAE